MCRAPLIRSAEYPPDYNSPAPGQPKNHAAEVNALAHIYNNRWKPVTEALQEFDAQWLEAEALWGPATRKEAEQLHRCATTVFVAIESILENARAGGRISRPTGNSASVHDRKLMPRRWQQTTGCQTT
jgi:hypothetical protein